MMTRSATLLATVLFTLALSQCNGPKYPKLLSEQRTKIDGEDCLVRQWLVTESPRETYTETVRLTKIKR